jgi:hypothetical protein
MSKTLLSAAAVTALLAVTAPASAQFASPFHIIPVVAKLKGDQGTDWRSDGVITNVSGQTVTVVLQFFREATSNTFTGLFARTITLAAGETRTIDDIVGTMFPAEGNTKGILLIMTQDDGGGTGELAVTTRTYNAADPNATYGQTVPSDLLAMIFGLGRSVMPGVGYNARFRTNIGVDNLGAMDAQVVVDIYDAMGTLVASTTHTVESFSLRQWSLAALGASNLTGGRVEVHLASSMPGFDPCDPGSSPFTSSLLLAYFSKADNATGDAVFGFGQTVWDDYANTCGTDPTDGCGNGNATQRTESALGLLH